MGAYISLALKNMLLSLNSMPNDGSIVKSQLITLPCLRLREGIVEESVQMKIPLVANIWRITLLTGRICVYIDIIPPSPYWTWDSTTWETMGCLSRASLAVAHNNYGGTVSWRYQDGIDRMIQTKCNVLITPVEVIKSQCHFFLFVCA
jgi:hypothetical protein